MNPEEVKVGETYNVRVKVVKKTDLFIHTKTCVDTALNGCYLFEYAESEVFSPINSADGTKSAENAQKYDPCRRFRKGDKVRLVEYKGRHFNTDAKRMWFCTGIVTSSECEHEYIDVCVSFGNSEEDIEIDPAYLELVKPVEEQEPYSAHVGNYEGAWGVYRDWAIETQALIVSFSHKHPHAKAAAEAERDRLNAEHRKEQSNG